LVAKKALVKIFKGKDELAAADDDEIDDGSLDEDSVS
jgi:hypothetical protein